MDTRIRGCRTISYSIQFGLILSLLAGCASAQCGDCDDYDPCTRDWCNGTQCQHDPQTCDQSEPSEKTSQETMGEDGPIGLTPTVYNPPATLPLEDVGPHIDCDLINCDDSDACTDDSCDPASGCVHINNAAPCDDGNACTKDDTCSDGSCKGAAISCDDGNDCTDDSCDPATGCVNANNAAPYDDGNACTKDDTCSDRSCKGAAISCDDGNDCTDDSCDPATGCVHINNTAPCDDGNACTKADTCSDGSCKGAAISCDDGNDCTDDSCDPATGCVHINNTAPCDDGNACTKTDTCSSGSCKGVAVRCDDHYPCTYDRCDRQNGCYYPNKCDDGEICIDGTCRYPYYYYYPYYFYYPYYPYYPYDMPYVQPSPAAATQAASKPQSYTMPAGTSITLPWGGTMLAAEDLQVYNGLAYPGATPVSLSRDLGSPAQVASIGRMALSAMNQWEMIGLSWKDGGFKMTLIQPNQIVLPAQGDGRNVVHLTGSNYDYYLLKSPTAGIWTVQIMPVNAASSGTGYSLISGLVQGPIPTIQA